MIATGIFWAVKAFAFLKTPVGRYLLGAIAIGLVAWWAYSKIEQGGYDRCKGDWDASVLRTNTNGDDATDRARDDVNRGVSDPFDADPGSRLQGNR
jgi:hypothetical protein